MTKLADYPELQFGGVARLKSRQKTFAEITTACNKNINFDVKKSRKKLRLGEDNIGSMCSTKRFTRKFIIKENLFFDVL